MLLVSYWKFVYIFFFFHFFPIHKIISKFTVYVNNNDRQDITSIKNTQSHQTTCHILTAYTRFPSTTQWQFFIFILLQLKTFSISAKIYIYMYV